MIFAAHICMEFTDRSRSCIRGMGFVIETGEDDIGKLLLIKDKDSEWFAMYVNRDDIMDESSCVDVYRVTSSVPPCIVHVVYHGVIRELRWTEHLWMDVFALVKARNTAELDSMFEPLMDRMGWVMTKRGMMIDVYNRGQKRRGAHMRSDAESPGSQGCL